MPKHTSDNPIVELAEKVRWADLKQTKVDILLRGATHSGVTFTRGTRADMPTMAAYSLLYDLEKDCHQIWFNPEEVEPYEGGAYTVVQIAYFLNGLSGLLGPLLVAYSVIAKSSLPLVIGVGSFVYFICQRVLRWWMNKNMRKAPPHLFARWLGIGIVICLAIATLAVLLLWR
jgi:hypothetical protein